MYSSGIKRNKKACTECRQQKVRCDALEDSNDPCTRCRKMKLRCVISDPFKREHKRQRLSELEHEATELRQRLESQGRPNGSGFYHPQVQHHQVLQPQHQPWAAQLATPTTTSTDSSVRLTPLGNRHMPSPHTQLPSISPRLDEASSEEPKLESQEPTIAQTIEGATLSAAVIDELFHRYFQEFHKFLPILDRRQSPNEYYRRSKFLFWTIVAVASRNYPKDPTLLDSFADKVLTLALMSLRHATIPGVKGMLMLLTWPLPRAAVGGGDVTFAISGSLIHMAMSLGLHIPTSAQDFSRVKVTLSETEIIKRAEIWGYCIVVYQRSTYFKGQAPLSLLDIYQDADQRHALFHRVSPSLKFQLKLNSLLTRCTSALLQHGLRLMTPHQESGLDLLIRVFEATIQDIEPECITDLDRFYLYLCRMVVQSFVFYKTSVLEYPNYLLTRLYGSACQVLHHIDRLNQDGFRLAAAPFHFVSATNCASMALLRLLKSSMVHYLDQAQAKETLFLGVNIMKRLSLESNDIPARVVMMITQLWNSDKAFRRPDGSEHIALRLRTRVAMSHVFDAIWWWREEFGGQSGAYPIQSRGTQSSPMNESKPVETPPINLQAYNNTTPTAYYPEMTFLDDSLLAELGWTNNSNYLYPAMAGPMNSDWYSPSNGAGFAL